MLTRDGKSRHDCPNCRCRGNPHTTCAHCQHRIGLCPRCDVARGTGSALRVVAAAIRTVREAVYHVDQPGRHHHVIALMHDVGCTRDCIGTAEQGFLLSDGRFVGRVEAMQVARAAGQLIAEHAPHVGLFSEDVW